MDRPERRRDGRAVGGQATVSHLAAATLGSHKVDRTQTTRTGCVRLDQSKSRPVVAVVSRSKSLSFVGFRLADNV